ncbi:MAG: hypothetical protein ISS33_06690 [Candidatus Omnitrophica bacterium]|nr:hypothetical protein [Candidatus Omnitrophota bacterium]
MKVAMMSAWNTDSGASVHAELIGRAFVEMGIDLKVFSFYRHSFHGTALTKRASEEERYVHRCFTVYGVPNPELNATEILASDFDVFVAEDLGMLPMKQLLTVFPEIKKKAKTVSVVHDGELSEKKEYFKFDWDSVVCFDNRYYSFLRKAYPEERLHIIPYPSFPYAPGDKDKARQKLGLAKDKRIVFLFGQAAEYAVNTALVLDRLADKYDIQMLLVTESENVIRDFRHVKEKAKFDFKVVSKFLDNDLLYEYLYAADCMLYNKRSNPNVVVGSTIFQCLGSGCPILTLDSNFSYSFNKEVIKYHDFYELEENLTDVFEKGPKYLEQQKEMRSYLERNSARPIAEKYLELFKKISKKQ